MEKFKVMMRVFVFFIIGIILFFLITPIFIPKTINEKNGFYRAIIQGFYTEPKNSLDVIFIGDSSIYRGVSPIKMWEEYGFTSYDFGSPAQKMWDSYYAIKEALDYQNPKVIVLHVDAAFLEYPMNKFNKRHLYDNMRYSTNKIEGIMDPVQKNKKQTFNLLFPLFRFHSRWSQLEDEDFLYAHQEVHYPSKGYTMAKGERPYKGNKNYMEKQNKKNVIGPKVSKYLEKIKDLCKEREVQLVFMETPSPKTWNKTKHEAIAKWAEVNHIPFLDLNLSMEEIGIDWEKDTHDKGDHMNIYGAEKISMYLGNYLKNQYQLPDHRNEKEYAQWHEDAKQYEEQKKQ